MTTEDELRRENEALRARLVGLELERIDEAVRANDAVAAAEDRVYWLDRWHLDLNALMKRRGVDKLLAVLRRARRVIRRLKRRATS